MGRSLVPAQSIANEGRRIIFIHEVVANGAALTANAAESHPRVPTPEQILAGRQMPPTIAVPGAVAGLQLDRWALGQNPSLKKARPIRVGTSDTEGVGWIEPRTKRDLRMTCTADAKRATRVRRACAPARRCAPARPCPAPGAAVPDGHHSNEKGDRRRPTAIPSQPPVIPDRSNERWTDTTKRSSDCARP